MTQSAQTPIVIAIDGPSGAGKSTVSRELARRLQGIYVDTGAMYRGITWGLLQRGIDPNDAHAVAQACDLPAVVLSTDPDAPGITVDGHPASTNIRSEEVTAAVSAVSAVAHVRSMLVAQQRQLCAHALAQGQAVVMEGRDIGSVVLPDAPVKVWLTADVAARAARRAAQVGADAARSLDGITTRDAKDATRAVSPAQAPHDAVVIDATDLGVEDVVAQIWSLIR